VEVVILAFIYENRLVEIKYIEERIIVEEVDECPQESVVYELGSHLVNITDIRDRTSKAGDRCIVHIFHFVATTEREGSAV
jgi:hypothetical protein